MKKRRLAASATAAAAAAFLFGASVLVLSSFGNFDDNDITGSSSERHLLVLDLAALSPSDEWQWPSAAAAAASPNAAAASPNAAAATDVAFPFASDIEYCNARPNNVVTPYAKFQSRREARPFSIIPQDFVPKHTERCDNVHDALVAIEQGRRVWDPQSLAAHIPKADEYRPFQKKAYHDELPWVHLEQLPSTFVPRGCDLPALSSDDVCDMVNRLFHKIVFVGDSLARHLRSGFQMTLSGDLIQGGTVTDSHSPSCQCDSQFDASEECRKHTDAELFRSGSPSEMGLCPHLDTSGQVTTDYLWRAYPQTETPTGLDVDSLHCQADDDDDRGLLVVANGGLHYAIDARKTYDEMFKPILDSLKGCSPKHKIYLIWNSMGLQSPTLDEVRPNQTRTRMMKFNMEMKAILDEEVDATNVVIVDWVGLTENAPTLDGIHNLAQVNYVKSIYLMHIASMMVEEEMTLTFHGR